MLDNPAVHLAPAAAYDDVPAVVRRLLDRIGGLRCAGQRVLLKPNWVLHENTSGAGLDCLITHRTLVAAVALRALEEGAASVIAADAPLQACDFAALSSRSGLDQIDPRAGIRDLRLVTRAGRDLWDRTGQTGRDLDRDYIRFDLGAASRLEPITRPDAAFRVTGYDPAALDRTHAPGRHEYLIAREIIDADLVVNLPKLKTHKKAGLTGALKNMVGANGHKSYLPHHRKGPGGRRGAGGDCYPVSTLSKTVAEFALDRGNASPSRAARFAWAQVVSAALRTAPDRNIEGAWHGNDTLWRTVVDLQSIVHYGTAEGTLAATPQRRILHLTDAVAAGQGDGPLAPEPYPCGLLTLAENAAAADWIHALLLGLDPRRIPGIAEAFTPGPYPLTRFAPDAVQAHCENETLSWPEAARRFARHPARLPEGWAGHIEWRPDERTAA
jgi:uncharacterized protein (DUF362 family)